MERQKCDYFQTGEYIYIANEWINTSIPQHYSLRSTFIY